MHSEERAVLLVKFRQLEAALQAVADDQEDNEDGDEGFDEDVYHILRHVSSATELLSGETDFYFEKAAETEVKRLPKSSPTERPTTAARSTGRSNLSSRPRPRRTPAVADTPATALNSSRTAATGNGT